MRSIVARLTVSYVLFVVIIMLVVGLLMQQMLTAYIHRSTVREMMHQGEVIARALVGTPVRSPLLLRELVPELVGAGYLVVSGDGEVLMGSGRIPGTFRPHELERAIRTRSPQVISRTTVSGAEVLAVIVPLEARDGAVVLIKPLREIDIVLAELRVLLLRGLLVGLAVALGLAYLLGRGLSNPIRELSRAAARFRAGDLDARARALSRDELGRLTEDFNEMADRIQAMIEGRRQLLASVSHELRTPVTSVAGFVEALREGIVPEAERGRYLDIIASDVERLNRLIDDLFQLARLETGELAFDYQALDLVEILRVEADRYDPRFRERGIDFRLRVGDELPVTADPDRVGQVLDNLLGNALKFTPDGGEVTVTARRVGGEAEVRVCDSGPGIPEKDLERIFDRFYKASNQRGGERGAGLGLAIAREIISRHGGRIWAERGPGGGTCIDFTLPLR